MSDAGSSLRADAPPARSGGASWRPILRGPSRDRALQAVNAITAGIAAGQDSERVDASLSSGSAGLALLFAQLAAAGEDKSPASIAGRYLDSAVEVLSSAPLGPSLYAGFTGVAWVAQVVGQLLDPEAEDGNEAIDDALLGLLTTASFEQAPYDLIHGLTGMGVYALERWPRPVAVQSVAKVVNHLAKLARHDEAGTYWWTGPSLLLGSRREQYPAGGIDLGVAHGIAGVLPFLARVSALQADDSSADALLDGAVRWLLAHTVQTEAGETMPYFVAEGADPTPARSAWCYGDPGVAAALLVAAREVGEAGWEDAATGLAARAAERPPELSGVTDAGFCHGSAGLAHLFNRMHQLTGERKLADAAIFWLERTLDLLPTAESVTPADSRVPDSQLPWDGGPRPWNGRGVLEGAAGVGLVLLAASTSTEPAWDRMFLVSRPAPQGTSTVA